MPGAQRNVAVRVTAKWPTALLDLWRICRTSYGESAEHDVVDLPKTLRRICRWPAVVQITQRVDNHSRPPRPRNRSVTNIALLNPGGEPVRSFFRPVTHGCQTLRRPAAVARRQRPGRQ